MTVTRQLRSFACGVCLGRRVAIMDDWRIRPAKGKFPPSGPLSAFCQFRLMNGQMADGGQILRMIFTCRLPDIHLFSGWWMADVRCFLLSAIRHPPPCFCTPPPMYPPSTPLPLPLSDPSPPFSSSAIRISAQEPGRGRGKRADVWRIWGGGGQRQNTTILTL